MQGILTFFIDGANKIDVSRFWHYFIVYEKDTGNIAAFTACYEAHKNAEDFRCKIALVFVYPSF